MGNPAHINCSEVSLPGFIPEKTFCMGLELRLGDDSFSSAQVFLFSGTHINAPLGSLTSLTKLQSTLCGSSSA